MGFATAAARARATRTAANLNVKHGFVFFEQAVKRAVTLDWLIVMEVDGDSTTRIEYYGHKIPTWMLYVRTYIRRAWYRIYWKERKTV